MKLHLSPDLSAATDNSREEMQRCSGIMTLFSTGFPNS